MSPRLHSRPPADLDVPAIVGRCQACGLEPMRRDWVLPSYATIVSDGLHVWAGPLEAVADWAPRWSGAELALAPVDFRFVAEHSERAA